MRDWTRPDAAMHEMRNRSGKTLHAACKALGLSASGSKYALAGRLLDAGLTADEVEARFGWRTRRSVSRGSDE